MAEVTATIQKEHYKTLVHSASNQIIADEPLKDGGEDLGFSPSELLAASLAACTSITLRMYADRKEFPLESVDVEVQFVKESHNSTFNRKIRLNGNLSEEQKKRLMQIANQCFIHKALSNPIEIVTQEL